VERSAARPAPAAAASAAASAPAPPAQGTTRIGFVDIEIVLESSQAIRTIMSEADAQLGEADRAIQEKRRELRKVRLSLEQQGSVLSETERQKRQQQAVMVLEEIDELEYRFQRTVRQKQQTTIEPLLAKVMDLIGDVGQRDGYDLIVRGELVLWGRETVDLTPLIVRECDLRIDELRRAVKSLPLPKRAESGPAPTATQPAPLPLIP